MSLAGYMTRVSEMNDTGIVMKCWVLINFQIMFKKEVHWATTVQLISGNWNHRELNGEREDSDTPYHTTMWTLSLPKPRVIPMSKGVTVGSLITLVQTLVEPADHKKALTATRQGPYRKYLNFPPGFAVNLKPFLKMTFLWGRI